MPSVFVDPSINNGIADWDRIETAVLEQAQYAVAEWRKQHPNSYPVIGDAINFTMDVKVKDMAGTQRHHNEIALTTKVPGMTFVGVGNGQQIPFGQANAVAPPAQPSGGGLWGAPSTSTSPTKVSTPVKKTPTHIPMPPPVSSSVKCFDCGGPAVVNFNITKCQNPNCKPKKSSWSDPWDDL